MIVFTCSLLFLIYLNVPAVLVRDHGAPTAVAALIPLLLVVPVAYRFLLQQETLRIPKLFVVGALFLVAQLVSAGFSADPLVSLEAVEPWALEGLVLALLLVNAIRSKSDLLLAAQAVTAAAAVMGLVVIAQQLAGASDRIFAYGFGQLDAVMVDDAGRTQRRLAGPIGETNRFAQVMLLALPIAFALAAASRRRWQRAFNLLAALLIGGGMLLAFSRGAIVALALALPFALWFGALRFRHLALGGLAVALALLSLPHYWERVASIGEVALQATGLSPEGLNAADGAARGRLTEMKAAGLLFLDHPVLGAGPGLAREYYPQYAVLVGGKVRAGTRRSHNLFMQIAAETGLVGLCCFAWLLWVALSRIDRARRRFQEQDVELWHLAWAFELSLLLLLLSSLFLHAAYVRYFWIPLTLAAALSALGGQPALIRLLSESLRRIAAQPQRFREARAP